MDRIGHYHLIKMIGKGHHSFIFEATNEKNKPCAVKLQTRQKWNRDYRVIRKFPQCGFLSNPRQSHQFHNPWHNIDNLIPWAGKDLWIVEYPLRRSLFECMDTLDLCHKRTMTIHILHALVLLSKKNIQHNDIHFGNILVEKTSKTQYQLFSLPIQTHGYRFALIDYDRSLMRADLNDDVLHFIFSWTNKDLVIQKGGFRSPHELWDHLQKHMPRLQKYMTRIPYRAVFKKSDSREFYITLLILEILFSTLFRKEDCRFRKISYTPLFLPKEDILFALYHYQNIPKIIDYMNRKNLN